MHRIFVNERTETTFDQEGKPVVNGLGICDIVNTQTEESAQIQLEQDAYEMPQVDVVRIFGDKAHLAGNQNCTVTKLESSENPDFPFEVIFNPEGTTEEIRSQKLFELKQYYREQSQDAHITSSVGIEINANDAASKDIEDLIRSIKGGIRSEPVSFCDYRNNFSNVSLENLEKMLLEVIHHQQVLKDKKFAVRDIITRSDEPENIDVQQEFNKSMGKTLSSPNVLLPVDI